jgi:hypothetical protein
MPLSRRQFLGGTLALPAVAAFSAQLALKVLGSTTF